MKEKFRQTAISRAADTEPSHAPFEPFILATRDLLLVPTPIAVEIPAYRALYQRLHASPAFCEMGFAQHFVARAWSDEETRAVIQSTDVDLSWAARGLGDFAVALRPGGSGGWYDAAGKKLRGGALRVALLEGDEYGQRRRRDDDDDDGAKEGSAWDGIEWAGYAGARDAIITSLRDVVADGEELPPWQEMVEVRYGVAPESWGKGIARQAIDAVMLWAASERGVRRFIAETEKTNTRSGAVLEKLGFRKSGTDYWKEPSEIEWERNAGPSHPQNT